MDEKSVTIGFHISSNWNELFELWVFEEVSIGVGGVGHGLAVEVATVENTFSVSTIEHLGLSDHFLGLNKPRLTGEFFHNPCRVDEVRRCRINNQSQRKDGRNDTASACFVLQVHDNQTA